MKYLHTMVRVKDIDGSLDFYCNKLGLCENARYDNEDGRFTLVFLSAPGDESAQVELTYNWDGDSLGEGSRNFGHLAYSVENIYETCQRLMNGGVTINRPRGTGAWPSCGHPTTFPLNCYRAVHRWNRQNPGNQWKIPGSGDAANVVKRLYNKDNKTKGRSHGDLHHAEYAHG